MPRILIVAGEASGDLHGANLAKALKELDPAVMLVGVGGAAMKAAGVQLVPGIDRLDIIGLIGPSAIKAVVQRFLAMRRIFRSEPWDLVVFIDNPGLNLRYAYFAKAAGLRVVYYIAPQIWAWRPGRMHWIKQRVDHVIVILPFEAGLYHKADVPCTFVGHPLLDSVAPSYDRAAVRVKLGLAPAAPVIGLLPGSRPAEVRALLPVMLEAAQRLQDARSNVQFILAQASSIQDNLLVDLLRPSPVEVRVFREQANEVMASSDLLLVASGTATLQAAVIGTPMILVYRVPWLTYWLAKLLVQVRWIGLVNLVAEREVVPELIQRQATAQRLSEAALHLLGDRRAYHEMQSALRTVRQALGDPGASRRAAEVVLAECRT